MLGQTSFSQIIKGKITNQSGEPIQYSTVYIQELRQGTTSNTKGDYELKLPAGKYMVTYQSLGFSPVFMTITVPEKVTVTKNVVLPMQYYEIPEVRITATGEDPAYIIMRKVIGLAPYYLNNIYYYKAEVYLKGNLVINKIPKLLQKSMKIETGNNQTTISAGSKKESQEKYLKAGDSFLMESFNIIEFTAPDKYYQKVMSIQSTFPDQGGSVSPMDFIQASFYQPLLVNIAVSPLSPQAFSYYNFKYLGASLQGNFTINKIQVIPKRKSQQVFEGTIYIIEDLWCLHSVDLTNENLAGKVRVQQLYIPVQDDIWMPVSHKFEINVSIMGIKADAGYGSSVKYLEVKPNKALEKPKSLTTDSGGRNKPAENKPDTIVSKNKKQIEKLLDKNELSNRDMVKLARLMEKESEQSRPDSTKKSLEIVDHTKHDFDKDADKRDTSYWNSIRPIPLSDIEMKSLRIADSTKASLSGRVTKNDTVKNVNTKPKNKFINTAKHIAFGYNWYGVERSNGNFSGLIDIKNLSFNTVDGFTYGVTMRLNKNWKNGTGLNINPDLKWAFSREQLMWRVNSTFRFKGLKQQSVFLWTGHTSKDIGNGGGINPFLNVVTSLLMKDNYLKLYDSKFVNIGFRSEIINGLNIELSSGYEARRVLPNNTSFSLIKYNRPYTGNTPVNDYLLPVSNPINLLQDQNHMFLAARLSYTPFQRYKINNGNKIPRGSDWPTFNLTWYHGINELKSLPGEYSNFDMLKFETSQTKNTGAFSEFRWRVRAGGVLDNRKLSYFDFFHFNAQPLAVLLNDYQDGFMLPKYYSLSTPEAFAEVHLKYTTPYLLIKLLPGISNTLMRENLSFSYLGSRYHKNYSEIGYSISEIFFLAELGIYAGFDDLKYKSVGAKLILRFN